MGEAGLEGLSDVIEIGYGFGKALQRAIDDDDYAKKINFKNQIMYDD